MAISNHWTTNYFFVSPCFLIMTYFWLILMYNKSSSIKVYYSLFIFHFGKNVLELLFFFQESHKWLNMCMCVFIYISDKIITIPKRVRHKVFGNIYFLKDILHSCLCCWYCWHLSFWNERVYWQITDILKRKKNLRGKSMFILAIVK